MYRAGRSSRLVAAWSLFATVWTVAAMESWMRAGSAWGAPPTAAAAAASTADIAYFESKVRPLLVRRCYDCHSNDGEHEGDLFLDSRAGWSVGGKSGPAIVPGRPDESLLIRAVRYDGLRMPPDERLPQEETAILEQWVSRGAPDPRVGPGAAPVRKGIDVEAARKHWAFQPVRAAAVPEVSDQSWPMTDVDRFILARLEQEAIRPAVDADPYAVLRRAAFDLEGLPPTPEEVDRFAREYRPASAGNDEQRAEAERAYERLVDGLLASPRFGERWARHWMDVARFAEADGHFFPEAWRYRDYLIQSFNDDVPFDQFIVEQIAGDLLPSATPELRDRRRIATGFLALGPNYYPRTENGNFMDVLDEQIDVVTRSLMGLSVACARCHDHKFDPIATTDYYALAGVLASAEIRKTAVYAKGKHTFLGVSTGLPLSGYEAGPVARWAELAEQSYLDGHAVVHMGWEVAALEKRRASADARERAEIDARVATLRKETARRREAGPAARQALRTLPPLPPMAMGASERSAPTNLRVHIRGEADNLGAEVPRGVPRIMAAGEPPAVGPRESGRLQLARAIADGRNPLTARVAVNRIWLHLFGEGLVRTPDDFGTMGERPSHPELLDYLAGKLVDEGWSTKRMIRELMLSRTYRLSVARDARAEEVDADNRLLWRRNRRRLETEAIRDAMSAFSGELDLDPPSRSLIGDFGPGTLRFDAEIIRFDGTKRSIYLPQPRARRPPMYALFDHVDLGAVTGRRDVTTVPLQALFLLNSEEVGLQGAAAARRLLDRPGLDDEARIELAFVLAYGRPATNGDRAIARDLLAGAGDRQAAWASLCRVLMSAPEFIYVH